MTERMRIERIRDCFTQRTRDVLDDVIYLARLENKQSVTRAPRQLHARLTASTVVAGVGVNITLQSYIEALPEQTQRELTAWMLFGREPYGMTVRDIAAVCSVATPSDKELAAYLANKTQLADYLQRARSILGI